MKINIIGAGVAGLSTGCYLQMNGFETEIFERHTTFGGLCTNWNRKGYTFESGFQWLLGSNSQNPFYLLWSELIDMKSLHFIHHKTRMDIEVRDCVDRFGSNVFHLYTNLDRFEEYLLSLAPEDKKPITQFIRSIRKMQHYEIPPMIREVPDILPLNRKIRFARYLPLLLFLNRVRKETNITFAAKLRNPFLKEVFVQFFGGDELPLLIHTLPLAFNDRNATGYPAGGSVSFVGNIEKRYLELGGKIRYDGEVEKIVTEQNRAVALLLKTGELIASDITVSAADWHFTIFDALEGKYVNDTILKLSIQERLKVYYSVFVVSLGVAADYSQVPPFMRFPLNRKLVSPDGTEYNRMEIHLNNYDPSAAPPGKTVVYLSFYTRQADFWIDLREKDYHEYLKLKKDFADQIIGAADERLPGLRSNIEVVDIATPATFQRYTHNWKGSVQGWLPGENIISRSPVKTVLPGLKNFFFTGHWTIPGGGLPVAIKSARDVAKIICHQEKIPFEVVPVTTAHAMVE